MTLFLGLFLLYSTFRKASITKARTLILSLMLSNISNCSSHRQFVGIPFLTSDHFFFLPAKTLIILRFNTFIFQLIPWVYQNLVRFHSRSCDSYNN